MVGYPHGKYTIVKWVGKFFDREKFETARRERTIAEENCYFIGQ